MNAEMVLNQRRSVHKGYLKTLRYMRRKFMIEEVIGHGTFEKASFVKRISRGRRFDSFID